MLRLQAWVGRHIPLLLPSRRRSDHVSERPVGRGPSESAGAPPAQVVLHSSFQRLAEHQPRLPHRARHDRDVGKLAVGALRTISAPHRHDESGDFASALQSGRRKRSGDDVREQGVGGHHDVRPGRQRRRQQPGPAGKEVAQVPQVARRKHGETRQRRSASAVERRRQAPYAAPAVSELLLFFRRIFDESVRRVRDHRLDRVPLLTLQPFHAIGVHQGRSAERPGAEVVPGRTSVVLRLPARLQLVVPAALSNEQAGRI